MEVQLVSNFKISLDEGGKAGAVLMGLSKAFDCIIHDLLIAKLHAYALECSQVPAFGGGGQSSSVVSKYRGPGACPQENFGGPRPLVGHSLLLGGAKFKRSE